MIKKIDDDHYEVVTETTQTLCLSELQQELKNLQKMNEEIMDFNIWRDNQIEDRKKFIESKPLIPTNELSEKIELIKNI